MNSNHSGGTHVASIVCGSTLPWLAGMILARRSRLLLGVAWSGPLPNVPSSSCLAQEERRQGTDGVSTETATKLDPDARIGEKRVGSFVTSLPGIRGSILELMIYAAAVARPASFSDGTVPPKRGPVDRPSSPSKTMYRYLPVALGARTHTVEKPSGSQLYIFRHRLIFRPKHAIGQGAR